jgi:hypothetical protein
LLPARAAGEVAGEGVRKALPELCRGQAGPFADVDLAQLRLDVDGQAEQGGDDLRGLARAQEVRAADRIEPLAGE